MATVVDLNCFFTLLVVVVISSVAQTMKLLGLGLHRRASLIEDGDKGRHYF